MSLVGLLALVLLVQAEPSVLERTLERVAALPRTHSRLVYVCEDITTCGGIGDRLRGLMTTFFMAMALNRRFSVWSPGGLPITRVFQPALLDWTTGKPPCDLKIDGWQWGSWKYTTSDFVENTTIFAGSACVCMRSNKPFGPQILNARPDLFGRQLPNAAFGTAFRFLFQPTPELAGIVGTIRAQTRLPEPVCFGCPNGNWAAVHFRVGLGRDAVRHEIGEVSLATRCFFQHPVPSELVYIASDRENVKLRLSEQLPNATYAQIAIAHVNDRQLVDAHIYAWAEFVILMHAPWLFMSRSGFSSWAAAASTFEGKPRHAIAWRDCKELW